MPRHKDIRSLETIPAATTQKESLPGSAPTSFPLCFQPLFVSNISKSKKILTRLNRFRAAWMSMWQSDLSEGKKSSKGTLLSFDWETVLIFYSVVGRQWRRASTNHLHVHQINLPGLTPQDWVSGGTVDLSTFSQVRIRRDFLSFLSPFVSFITLVVISRSWDFFLLSAQWKVDKRPLCLLTPSFPFNKLFFFLEKKLQASRRLRRKLITKREFLLLSFTGVFISQDTISCSIAHHHAGIFLSFFFFFLHLKAAAPLPRLTLEKSKAVLVYSGGNTTVCEEIKLSQTALFKTETSWLYPFKKDITKAQREKVSSFIFFFFQVLSFF